jgi:ATP-dependent Clp protease ATP-binding subunit ClpB
MRIDKLTTKFQEALSDAQSLALGGDHAYIEPSHVLVAMLRQDDGPKSLLQRAGANVSGLLSSAEDAMNRLPKVEGQEQVQVGRDTVSLIQAAEKEAIKRGDQFVASHVRQQRQLGQARHAKRTESQVARSRSHSRARRPKSG